jgi:hypothetical protein
MLDHGHETSVIAALWEQAELRTRLPERHDGDPGRQGPTPRRYDCRRGYHRFYLRGKAIVVRNGALLGVYTKDVSRKGFGLLSPQQLFPKEQVELHAANGQDYRLQIVRCRRIDERCYECAASFLPRMQS